MLKPKEMSHLDITIHRSLVSAFLNVVPKYKIHIAEFKDLKEKKHHHHHLRREHQFRGDFEILEQKINEIEENIIFYYQNLEIDPKEIEKISPEKRYKFEIKSVDDGIDKLYERTSKDIRILKGAFKIIEEMKANLTYYKNLKKILIWLHSYSPSENSFKWFDNLEFNLFYSSSNEFTDIEIVLEHEEIPMVLEYYEMENDLTAFFTINNKINSKRVNEICHTAKKIEDFKEFFSTNGLNLDNFKKKIEKYEKQIDKAKDLINKKKEDKLKYRAYMELLTNFKKYQLIEMQFRESYRKEIVRLEAYIPTGKEEIVCEALDKKFHDKIRIVTYKMSQVDSDVLNFKNFGTDSEDYDFSSKYEKEREKTVPSLVETKKIFKPFTLLTELYGTTGYKEIDPTPAAALTFPILFGVMFGDIGHGLMLITLGIILIFSNIKNKKSKSYDSGFLLIWLGIAATIAGIIFGEFFGYKLDIFGIDFVVIEPMEEIVLFLKITILIGIFQLSLGWFISMLNYFHQKKNFLAFADPFMKILILIGGSILIFKHMFNIEEWISPPYPILLPIIPTILFIIIKPPGKLLNISYLKEDSVGGIIGEQAIDVTETYIGILSNVASYSRLLALAMAHMGLMLVVTTLVEEIQIKILVLRYIIAGIVLILGNIFVIVMESVLAGIHALRLTFYEFFGKFYIGDGIPFAFTDIESDFSMIEFNTTELLQVENP